MPSPVPKKKRCCRCCCCLTLAHLGVPLVRSSLLHLKGRAQKDAYTQTWRTDNRLRMQHSIPESASCSRFFVSVSGRRFAVWVTSEREIIHHPASEHSSVWYVLCIYMCSATELPPPPSSSSSTCSMFCVSLCVRNRLRGKPMKYVNISIHEQHTPCNYISFSGETERVNRNGITHIIRLGTTRLR